MNKFPTMSFTYKVPIIAELHQMIEEPLQAPTNVGQVWVPCLFPRRTCSRLRTRMRSTRSHKTRRTSPSLRTFPKLPSCQPDPRARRPVPSERNWPRLFGRTSITVTNLNRTSLNSGGLSAKYTKAVQCTVWAGNEPSHANAYKKTRKQNKLISITSYFKNRPWKTMKKCNFSLKWPINCHNWLWAKALGICRPTCIASEGEISATMQTCRSCSSHVPQVRLKAPIAPSHPHCPCTHYTLSRNALRLVRVCMWVCQVAHSWLGTYIKTH